MTNNVFFIESFTQLEKTTKDKRMQTSIQKGQKAAVSDSPCLVVGESGTGKEIFARAIHNESKRKTQPFVPVNCSALTETLMESELFGFEKGAFTGADRQRKGRFELANKGTLFLDEIGDMSPLAQAKILRALEYKEFERVGSEDTIRVETRVIAATNRPLSELIREGRFRKDLYYRINEITIEIPPLRERISDIPILVDYFIKEYNNEADRQIKGCSEATISCLMDYHWPGNVRELKSVIRRASALSERDILWIEDLGIKVDIDIETRYYRQDDLSLETFERKHIERVLRITGGNKSRTCSLLGITRPTLDQKIKKYNINIQ